MAAAQAPLDAELRQRPIRELRGALLRLGRQLTGCVERSDFISCLLEASTDELAVALGQQAVGEREHSAMIRRLLDGSRKPSTDQVPESADAERLTPGSIVRLFNLQSAPALNMQRAVVLRHDASTDRYEVRLDWDGSVKKVRYDNLQVEETSSAPASTPSPQPAADMADADPAPKAEVVSPNRQKASSADALPSPGASFAESMVEALAAECGLDAVETTAESPGKQVADTAEAPTGVEEPIALPKPCPATTFAAQECAAKATSGETTAFAMPPSATAIAEPIVLPTAADQASVEASADASMNVLEPAAPCQDGEESRSDEAAESLASTTDTVNEIQVEPRSEGDDRKGLKRVASDITCSPGKEAQPAACNTSSFSLPTPSMKVRGLEAPAPVSILSKKPVKLRVAYDVGRHPADERGFMAEGLRQLWRGGEMCDVTLACRESTFRVHRVVMASQSQELRDFIGDKSVAPVPDIQYPESLQILIECIYEAEGEKGYAPSCSEVNMEVLELAHRFQIERLKRRAASFMAQNLTSHNVLKHVGDCDTFALQDLKDKIVGHLAVNKKVLAELTDGPHLSKHPELLRQILMRVASPKDHTGPNKRARAS